MKQAYITVPLAIAYWFIPTDNFDSDSMLGYIIFGAMFTIGALTDIEKVKFKRKGKK